jgi:hypothetical protein
MDENRRKFLKVALIGSGAILMEKILTPLFSGFLNNSSAKTGSLDKTGFKSFQIVEDKEKLSIRDSSGEEIFQIDNKV